MSQKDHARLFEAHAHLFEEACSHKKSVVKSPTYESMQKSAHGMTNKAQTIALQTNHFQFLFPVSEPLLARLQLCE